MKAHIKTTVYYYKHNNVYTHCETKHEVETPEESYESDKHLKTLRYELMSKGYEIELSKDKKWIYSRDE